MKWYAWVFAVCTIVACGVLLPGVQANGIASSLNTALGIVPEATAAILAVLLGFIIFGGVQRIARFAEIIVPFMALGYIIVACVIIALHIDRLPDVLGLILRSAVGADAGFGALLGLAIQWGVKRGVYPMKPARAPARMRLLPLLSPIRPSRVWCRRSRCMWTRCLSARPLLSCC